MISNVVDGTDLSTSGLCVETQPQLEFNVFSSSQVPQAILSLGASVSLSVN